MSLITPKQRWFSLMPAYAVIGIFMLLPLLIMVGISLMEQNVYGGVHKAFSPEAYLNILYERDLDDLLEFNPAYLIIIARSVILATLATLFCLLLGFPVAYYIASQPKRRRNLLIFLVTIPFWTNLLVRCFAWVIILGRGGVLDTPFVFLGIIDESFGLLYSSPAILIGLTYAYLPLMILPMYSSLEKMDSRLMEAAADLYSSSWETLRHIVIPLALPGIIAGSILVFIPALGDFISPDLLGGAKNLTLGSLVHFQFITARNWPFGAAVAVVLLLFVMVNMMLYVWVSRRNQLEKEHG